MLDFRLFGWLLFASVIVVKGFGPMKLYGLKFDREITSVSFTILLSVANGFGPKKLYSLEFDRDISSVSVINRQLIITAPYQISVIDNIQWKFRQRGRMNSRVINKEIADPRLVGKIPPGTFKGDRTPSYWVSSRGTNFSNGAIYVMQQTTNYSLIKDITVDSGWNYERTQWVDMNRDGRKDCLTARYRGGVGQMLWFEQPSGQTIWGQHIIHQGLADGNFVGFIYDKKTYIAVAGNQLNTLGLYWTLNAKNNWMFSRQLRHRVVDNYGKYYDVQYVDLNKDGRPDILTTTVQIANSRGQVLGYEIPYDIQNAIWDRHVLAGGFVGDYSPGKAQAFWPNKWKRKSDRPTIFLTGGSESILYILSPTPKNKGWGYYKSELTAGVGVPGIPFIVDLNGDSFPEIFVPQGGHLHVFSYNYQSSAAEPPKRRPSSSAGKVTITRPPVKFRPPFFRPLPTAPPPAIPNDASPVGPRPINSFSGPAGTGGSSANGQGNSGANVPAGRPARGGTANRPAPPPASDPQPNNLAPSFAFNPLGGNPNSQNVAAPPSGQNTVLGNDGWLYTRTGYLPDLLKPAVANTSGAPAAPVTVDTSYTELPPSDLPYFPSEETPLPDYYDSYDAAPPNLVLWVTEETFVYRREAIDVCEVNNRVLCSLSQLQDAVRNGGIVPDFDWGWFEIENRAATLEGCIPGELRWKGFECYNGDVAHTPVLLETSLPSLCCSVIRGANVTKQKFVYLPDLLKPAVANTSGAPAAPVTVDTSYTELPPSDLPYFPSEETPLPDYYDSYDAAPPNLVLWVTEETFVYRREAIDVCEVNNRVLCSLSQLQDAVRNGGIVPDFDWGWFEIENRAATLEGCIPGELRWKGFECYNGDVAHTPVLLETSLPSLCCSVIRGANVTKQKFVRKSDAEKECKKSNCHLCSIEEMMNVWDQSTYKDLITGWFDLENHVVKMTHSCDVNSAPWPGYMCIGGKLEVSEVHEVMEEQAFCCSVADRLLAPIVSLCLSFATMWMIVR